MGDLWTREREMHALSIYSSCVFIFCLNVECVDAWSLFTCIIKAPWSPGLREPFHNSGVREIFDSMAGE